jgi:hypothetical protein
MQWMKFYLLFQWLIKSFFDGHTEIFNKTWLNFTDTWNFIYFKFSWSAALDTIRYWDSELDYDWSSSRYKHELKIKELPIISKEYESIYPSNWVQFRNIFWSISTKWFSLILNLQILFSITIAETKWMNFIVSIFLVHIQCLKELFIIFLYLQTKKQYNFTQK